MTFLQSRDALEGRGGLVMCGHVEAGVMKKEQIYFHRATFYFFVSNPINK